MLLLSFWPATYLHELVLSPFGSRLELSWTFTNTFSVITYPIITNSNVPTTPYCTCNSARKVRPLMSFQFLWPIYLLAACAELAQLHRDLQPAPFTNPPNAKCKMCFVVHKRHSNHAIVLPPEAGWVSIALRTHCARRMLWLHWTSNTRTALSFGLPYIMHCLLDCPISYITFWKNLYHFHVIPRVTHNL